MQKTQQGTLKSLMHGLLIYRKIWQDPVLHLLRRLLICLEDNKEFDFREENAENKLSVKMGQGSSHRRGTVAAAYYDFLGALLESEAILSPGQGGSLWQGHVLDVVLALEHPMLEILVQTNQEDVESSGLWHLDIFKRDLGLLSELFWLFEGDAAAELKNILGSRLMPEPGILHALHGGAGKHASQAKPQGFDIQVPLAEMALREAADELKQSFFATRSWDVLARPLINYYTQFGMGQFAKYPAFIWSGDEERTPVGVSMIDPIRLHELSGYDEQVEKVVHNTLRFIRGLPAHNILLYGDRGTGKSSTVKALIHEFVGQGLRLVEVNRDSLRGLSELVKYLERSPLKFIVFIDDLSFEEDETEFKALKSILEGSVVKQPDNVRIYATSNRRHLIKESFNDMNSRELREQDTVQEKLSLSDRFGLTVIYPSPDQKTYLDIVEHLAAVERLSIDPNELRERALQWTLWHNERSGRTARQFIDDLKAQLEMEADQTQ
ncbi:MAG: ATP-binding protein [Firmicutes bacterium]|nr:ATP-binding protein [Bacillota bacterium]